MFTNKKIGLALGSGGARGIAHIGVIKVLEEKGIKIDYIAGTSIGALIGALYCQTKNIQAVENFALSMDWKILAEVLFDFSFRGGMITGDKIEKMLRKQLDDVLFANLKIPLNVVCADLRTGEKVVFDSGDIAQAVRASISVPIIFKPFERDGALLVDGGLVEPVPVQTVRKMGADFVIAVNLDAYHLRPKKKENFNKIPAVAEQIFNIARHNLAKGGVVGADLVIEPDTEVVGVVGWKEFLEAKTLMSAGEDTARKVLK